jgi:TrmH family RNA methyltransferase
MVSKSELKYIQSLSDKKVRLESGCFIAEGVKLVGEMMLAGYPIKQLYALDSWAAPNNNINVRRIEAFELAKMSTLQTPNQVLAVVEIPKIVQPITLAGQLTLVLDGIQDPGNLGTIIRIADWFGITQIIASEDTVDIYNPKVIGATMGSFMRVSVSYKNLVEWLPTIKVPIYGALLKGANVFATANVTEGLLVIGSEAKGIRENILDLITYPVTIPKIGGAESLNAAVATGIIVAQLTR